MINSLNRLLLNFILLVLLLYFAVYASWYAAYSNYFFFPVVYEMQEIGAHIDKFAPQNRKGKRDFASVDHAQHISIFNQMLRAVNSKGEGLAEIKYETAYAEREFLTRDEVVHLQDVADLISLLKSFDRLVLVLLVIVVLIMMFGGIHPYGLLSMVYLFVGAGAGLAGLLGVLGFEKVFYWMHTVVFPEGHKWFFYYQESLMSTLLKAPDSFAVFGVMLGVFALIAFAVLYLFAAFFIVRIIRKYRGGTFFSQS